MSFQAYLDNIKVKTGKTPRQLKDLAVRAGVLKSDMKAGELVRGSRRSSIWDTATPWRSGLRSNRTAGFALRVVGKRHHGEVSRRCAGWLAALRALSL